MGIGLQTPLKLEGNGLLLFQNGGAGGIIGYGQEQVRFRLDGYLVSRAKAYLPETGQRVKGPSKAWNNPCRKIDTANAAI